MKSTQRPSKPPKQQPKSNDSSPKTDFTPIVDESIKSQPVVKTVNKPAISEDKPQTVYADPHEESNQKSKPQPTNSIYPEKPQLSTDHFQHIQFLDCDQPVGRIIFECYHCQQGIISEFTGEPVMGEYKGYPSLIQVKIQCPNCEQTAIRLTTGEVLSTTAIPSPWQ